MKLRKNELRMAARHAARAWDRRMWRFSDRLQHATDRYDEWAEKRRIRALKRNPWPLNLLLALSLGEVLLVLIGPHTPGMIHAAAGLAMVALALRILREAAVIRAKKRGEL